MTITATILYSVVVVVGWLSLLYCCGLGRNDSISGNNISAATTQLPGILLQGSKPCNECLAVLLLFLPFMKSRWTSCQNELEIIP
jgi:hypothetical protein